MNREVCALCAGPVPMRPKPRLSQRSLEDALIAIAEMRDDRGRRLNVRPSQVLSEEILRQVPPGLR